MAALFNPLTENLYTASAVSTGAVLAWAMLLLIQVLYFRRRIKLRKVADHRAEVALLNTENELAEVRRECTMNRLENRILREFVSQPDIDKSIATLMRRFVPNQRDGFCALVQFQDDEAVVLHARGLTDNSQQKLSIESSLRNRLLAERHFGLERAEILESGILDGLSREDREKTNRLFLISEGDDSAISFTFISTALFPVGGGRAQQIELSKRLLAGIARCLLQMQSFQRQQDELRATNERMKLRSIADCHFESPADMMHEFLEALLKMVKTDRVAFFLSQPEAEVQRTALCRCGIDLQPGAQVRWQLHEQRIVEVSSDEAALREYDRRQLAQHGVGTLIGRAIVVPVQRERTTTAHIVCTRRNAEPYAKAEQELLTWSGRRLAEAIERWLSFVNVERQAKRDGLTDLANRREFDDRISKELARNAAEGGRCSLVLFDLDHFKAVNDNHGHQAGDYVLKKCALVINECLAKTRETDRMLVARYGGEEVAVLLPDVPEPGAARIAEAIRSDVEQTRFEFNDTTIPITVSAGIATAVGSSMSVTELVGATDAALYAAKELGRNRVIRATELTIRMD